MWLEKDWSLPEKERERDRKTLLCLQKCGLEFERKREQNSGRNGDLECRYEERRRVEDCDFDLDLYRECLFNGL